MNIAKEGFAGAAGGLAAVVMYVLLGMLIFVPGMILLKKEKEKPKEKRNTVVVVFAYVLMFLGAALALGLGFGILAENVVGEF